MEQPEEAPPCATVPGSHSALVLAGGGALGAYEAGVLHYVLEILPREVGRRASFGVFAGTSVGALNVSFLAANADDPAAACRRLVTFWRSLTLEQVLRFGPRELGRALRLLLGPGGWLPDRGRGHAGPQPVPAPAPHRPVAGLFDTSRLHDQLRRHIDWDRLSRNLDSGLVRGIALCATEVCTGTSTIFFQTGPGTEYRAGRDPHKEARRVRINVDHAMASAAIPFLFPSVQIDGVCYVDGALRQNTPLNPALRMGADRLLVVSLTQVPHQAKQVARTGCRRNPYPGALFLLGKTAMVFMTQTLDYELGRVQMYNRLIAGGCQLYGEGFLDSLNSIMGPRRNASYRPVHTCHIRPSESLSLVALQALQQAPRELHLPGPTGRIVTRVLGSAAVARSDLLGYLLFTPTHIRMLLELGRRDAQARRDDLMRMLWG